MSHQDLGTPFYDLHPVSNLLTVPQLVGYIQSVNDDFVNPKITLTTKASFSTTPRHYITNAIRVNSPYIQNLIMTNYIYDSNTGDFNLEGSMYMFVIRYDIDLDPSYATQDDDQLLFHTQNYTLVLGNLKEFAKAGGGPYGTYRDQKVYMRAGSSTPFKMELSVTGSVTGRDIEFNLLNLYIYVFRVI